MFGSKNQTVSLSSKRPYEYKYEEVEGEPKPKIPRQDEGQ